MAERRTQFTTDEVLTLLQDHYDIPGDGEQSEFSDSDHESDTNDILGTEDVGVDLFSSENTTAAALDDLHAIDIIESDNEAESEVEVCVGPVPRFDFTECEWTKNTKGDFSKHYGRFTQNVGPTTTLPSTATALEFFKLLFSMNIVNKIVLETNKYAKQQFEASGKDFALYKPVTTEEIMVFLGIVIAMGIHRLPSVRDYWSNDWVLGVPALTHCMTLCRFELILRYLHLNDNANQKPRGEPGYDKLFKVRPFIDAIRANFLNGYLPGENQAIDEAMIKFKGRTSLKQYMPKKPIKRGIKMWCRADSKSGYLSDFDIYVGRSAEGAEKNLGYSVVTRLCRLIYGKWHTVYFDNFFTSLSLIEELFSNKVISCGTVRSGRRGFPKEMFDKAKIKKLNRGEFLAQSKGPIKLYTWQDNKPVQVAATIPVVAADEVKKVKRRKKDGDQQDVTCPYLITMYNKHMGGVDKNDQLCSYYSIPSRSKKWWPRIFFALVDRCIVNSYILECESPNHTKRHLKQFQIELVKLLIGNKTSRKPSGRRSFQSPVRFTERHFPSFTAETGNGTRVQRRCKVCPKKPTYQCTQCDVGLCPAPCFQIYHTP